MAKQDPMMMDESEMVDNSQEEGTEPSYIGFDQDVQVSGTLDGKQVSGTLKFSPSQQVAEAPTDQAGLLDLEKQITSAKSKPRPSGM